MRRDAAAAEENKDVLHGGSRVGYTVAMADAPQAKPRWYRLTPERVVLGLLAVEGFLLLSEWFCWFPFNRHKGYTVLVAAASIGATGVLVFLWFLAAAVFRWQFQFSIRSLLLLTVVVAIPCSWLTVGREQAGKQREAVAAIRAMGGLITYDYEAAYRAGLRAAGAAKGPPTPPGPAWARRLLGEDLFADVIEVGPFPSGVVVAGPIVDLSSPITDACLMQIGKLPRLEVLDLGYSQVSDAGLKELHGLTRLRKLSLNNTGITDAGLEQIGKVTGLEMLNLSSARRISDAGLEKLAGLTRLQELNLSGTGITDLGLKHIAKLARLEVLDLSGTHVTDAGRQPTSLVPPSWDLPGLEQLSGLSELRRLHLQRTAVTGEGAEKFHRALPKCEISFDVPRGTEEPATTHQWQRSYVSPVPGELQ